MYEIDFLARRTAVRFRWHSVLLTLCTSIGLVSFGIHAGGLLLLEKGDRETRAALDSEIQRLAVVEEGVYLKLEEKVELIGSHAGRILWAPFVTAITECLPSSDHLKEIRYGRSGLTAEIDAVGPGGEAFRNSLAIHDGVIRFFPHMGGVIPGDRGGYRIILSREEDS